MCISSMQAGVRMTRFDTNRNGHSFIRIRDGYTVSVGYMNRGLPDFVPEFHPWLNVPLCLTPPTLLTPPPSRTCADVVPAVHVNDAEP